MESLIIIYGLADPRNSELRYVGQTVDGHARLDGHVKNSTLKKGRINRNVAWVRSLINSGVTPEIFTIEDVGDPKLLDEAEEFYVGYYRMLGANLNNANGGGKQYRGYKWKQSPEAIAKAIANHGPVRDPAKKSLKLRISKTGMKMSEETKMAISKTTTGKQHSPEHTAKVAAACRGKKRTPEQRARMSAARYALLERRKAHG